MTMPFALCILDLIDLINKFNLQAVGYSRSSLPRGTRTTHNKTNNNIHNLQKKLTTQHTVATTKTYIITLQNQSKK